MTRRHPAAAGFTLIELLIVLAIMGVLVGIVLPDSTPAIDEQLRLAADVLKTDLAYARSLAITSDSTYRIAFDEEENRYVLTHTGSNPALDRLPDSPFRAADDPPDQHIVDFDELPQVTAGVRFVTAAAFNLFLYPVADVEYGSLGEPSRGGYTVIWLAAGEGDDTKYVYLLVYPVTGMVEVGDTTTVAPPEWLVEASTGF